MEFTKEDIKELLLRLAAAAGAGEEADAEEAEALLMEAELSGKPGKLGEG